MSDQVRSVKDEFQKGMQAVAEYGTYDSYLTKRLELVEAESNADITFRFKSQPEDSNFQGTIHGGIISALADMVCSYSIGMNDPTKLSWSTDLNISYISSAKVGENILLKAKCPKYGKSLAFSTLEIYQESNNRLLAIARLTKMISSASL